jgi:hypothetical protein
MLRARLTEAASEPTVSLIDHEQPLTDEAGKAAAVALFVHGITTLEQTAAAFARHPQWKHR